MLFSLFIYLFVFSNKHAQNLLEVQRVYIPDRQTTNH